MSKLAKSGKSVKPSVTATTRAATPVHAAGDEFCSAVIANDLAKVKKMIRGGVNINKKNDAGFTPLFLASFYGCLEVLKYLLRQDEIEVNAVNKGDKDTALHAAVTKSNAIGRYKIVENLIGYSGSSFKIKDAFGKTPLHYAVHHLDPSCIDSLKILNLVAATSDDVDARDGEGNTALHYAAYKGSIAAIITLLFHGARLSIKNKKGQTPVDLAEVDSVKDAFTVWKVINSYYNS